MPMTKRQMIDDPNSVWNKTADDEFVFVVVERDRLAPYVARHWAMFAERNGVREEKVAGAREFADTVEQSTRARTPT